MAKMFSYRAMNRSGQVLAGELFADSEAVVAAHIRHQGYFVTRIAEARGQLWPRLRNRLQRVTAKDLAVLCRQFATMVDAGLSLTVCLDILQEQTHNALLKGALRDVSYQIREGETLSRAMGRHRQIFPGLMVSMMEAAEVGGVLDIVLNRLAVHFEKEYKLNEKVKSALYYPAIVLAVAAAAVTFIITFVLPVFMDLFVTMKVTLPLPTRVLLAVSDFLKSYGPAMAAIVAAAGYGLARYVRGARGRGALDRLLWRLPIFGTLWRKVAIARFSRTLATLLRGGVPILTALEAVKNTAANTLMTRALSAAQTDVREGVGLAATLGASRLFPPMVVQMAAVGEEAGELDKMLDKVADFYDNDVDDTVSRLSALMEPVLIGVLAVIIGAVVVSVALPMFDAVTSIGKMSF